MVLFAHGAGSSRLSPRNRFVADALGAVGLGTLLLGLLTEAEAAYRATVLTSVYSPTASPPPRPSAPPRPCGRSASPARVSRPSSPAAGGRTWPVSGRPRSPLPPFLTVGGGDSPRPRTQPRGPAVLPAAGPTRLAVVPGATPLFEGPGALSEVAELARDWFLSGLRPGRAAATQPAAVPAVRLAHRRASGRRTY